MKKGHRCSLQYHKKKHETIYVLSGTLKILIGSKKKKLKTKELKKNQSKKVKHYMIHRMAAVTKYIYLKKVKKLKLQLRLQSLF